MTFKILRVKLQSLILGFCMLALSLPVPVKASSLIWTRSTLAFAVGAISSQAIAADEDDDGEPKEKKKTAAQCKKAQQTAKSACTDGKSTAGMNQNDSQQFMMAMMAATAAGSALQSGSGGAGQMLACSLMGPLLMNLMKANGMKGEACEKSVKKCDEACGSKSAKGKDGGDSGCDYGGQADDAIMNALAMGAAVSSVVACMAGTGRAATQASTTPTPTPLQTCEDPVMAATDISCKCDVAKNPRANPLDPICSKPTGLGAVVGLSGEARPGSPMQGLDDLNVGGTIGYPEGGAKPSKGNGDGTSGGGGAGPSASGQLQALNRDQAPSGPGGKDINTSIITGQTGGQGMVAAGGGGSSTSLPSQSSGGSLSDRFNLSKFIPKKDFLQRGVAGMSVPAVDGMTGPNGPSIWEKSTSRYQDEDSKGRFMRGPTLTPRTVEAAAPARAQPTATKKK